MATNNSNKPNQYALITGGTSGIGYELATLFAKDGHNLILVARSDERLLDVADEFRQHGVDVVTLEKDLFEAQAANEIFREIKTRGLDVFALVNNAGQGQHGKFWEVPLERHLALIQLNVVALVTLTRLFLDGMIARNEGKILNLASVVSKTPAPEFSVYAASKAFVLSFTEALAKEVQDTNITITALIPGRTDTDFFRKADMIDTKEYQDHTLADPEDVAKAGYDALMSGDTRVIAGAKNKMMVGMMNTRPDSANAATMQKNNQPSEKTEDERRSRPDHEASNQEKESFIEGDEA
jgi:short-subunit dehydrogenase